VISPGGGGVDPDMAWTLGCHSSPLRSSTPMYSYAG
jgi:hypothetical protein